MNDHDTIITTRDLEALEAHPPAGYHLPPASVARPAIPPTASPGAQRLIDALTRRAPGAQA